MFVQQYPSSSRAASEDTIAKRLPIASSREPSGSWEVFVSLWEHANLLRAYCWTQQCGDEKALLNQFLVRLRRLFSVDFCFGALGSKDSKLVEFGVPESGMANVPANLSQRCLDIVANSRAPIAWNDVSGEFGFRSAVVVPVTPPAGQALGFLLLGHTIRRGYTTSELFLLQTLASELSWAVRTLNGNNRLRERLAAMSHDIKNSLQLIVSNSEFMRQNKSETWTVDQEKSIDGIESSVENILKNISSLPKPLPGAVTQVDESDRSVVDIAAAVEEAVTACRQLSQERGVKVAVDGAEAAPSQVRTDPVLFKLALQVLINNAVAATRNETVEFAFRGDESHLRFEIKGMTSNQVAQRLTAMFDEAIGLGGANDENHRALLSVREYLDQIGGDVYMRSRPGRASEFIASVPLERGS